MTTLPVYYTGAYQTKQTDAGLPGGASVLDALANPPATAVTAQTDSRSRAAALGVLSARSAPMLALRTANRDYLRDQYDTGSILKDGSGNVIV